MKIISLRVLYQSSNEDYSYKRTCSPDCTVTVFTSAFGGGLGRARNAKERGNHFRIQCKGHVVYCFSSFFKQIQNRKVVFQTEENAAKRVKQKEEEELRKERERQRKL